MADVEYREEIHVECRSRNIVQHTNAVISGDGLSLLKAARDITPIQVCPALFIPEFLCFITVDRLTG